MTPQEQLALFADTSTVVRAALLLDGNGDLFEAAMLADDPGQFFARLNAFANGLAASALRFYPDATDEVGARIADDVKLVTDRIGWTWAIGRSKPKGSC